MKRSRTLEGIVAVSPLRQEVRDDVASAPCRGQFPFDLVKPLREVTYHASQLLEVVA
jgi:hypothetical protein